MTVARETRRKEDRLELRLQPAQRRLLDEAADASAMSTSAFVLSHATAAAQNVLADRTRPGPVSSTRDHSDPPWSRPDTSGSGAREDPRSRCCAPNGGGRRARGS